MNTGDLLQSDGKTVEYETAGYGTHLARVHVKIREGVPELALRILSAGGTPKAPEPLTLDASFLQPHPIPARAEFLLAENPRALLARI